MTSIQELLKDTKVLAVLALAIIELALVWFYGGAMLIPMIPVFGILTWLWKDKHITILALFIFVFIALSSFGFTYIKTGGEKFFYAGIDFSGGTRIPVLLDTPVTDPTIMDEMIQTIKQRASSFGGLGEIRVRAIGNSEIHVELPNSDPAKIAEVQSLLAQQGVFLAVVDGKVALSGDDLFPGTIGKIPSQYLNGNADWGVAFSVTQSGASSFAQIVNGKANYPLLMFIDRPTDSILLISKKDLTASTLAQRDVVITDDEALSLAKKSLELDTDPIELYLTDDFDSYKDTLVPKTNKTKAIISSNTSSEIKSALRSKGFTIIEKTDDDMSPKYSVSRSGPAASNSVNEWPAIGLLSAPRLVAEVTNGIPNYGYTITGPAEGTGTQRTINADMNARKIDSILKGGALPVQISLGSTTTIPPSLGSDFLRASVIGAAFALFAISLFVALRYRTPKVIIPIILISVSEMIILVAIMGSFAIDLASMAGIIASIGVSVDAQVVVTDELRKKDQIDPEKKLEKAFSIVMTNALVAIVAMIPLFLFSGLVEIIGFASSHILGSLLGVLISRPAYGAIVEWFFEH